MIILFSSVALVLFLWCIWRVRRQYPETQLGMRELLASFWRREGVRWLLGAFFFATLPFTGRVKRFSLSQEQVAESVLLFVITLLVGFLWDSYTD